MFVKDQHVYYHAVQVLHINLDKLRLFKTDVLDCSFFFCFSINLLREEDFFNLL